MQHVLRRRLDALDDHPHAQRPGQGDHGVNHVRIGAVRAQGAHERAVDLEHVDGEPVQEAQRRVAGAEIVDRQADPHGAQPVQRAQCEFHVLHDGALRDFQCEPIRC